MRKKISEVYTWISFSDPEATKQSQFIRFDLSRLSDLFGHAPEHTKRGAATAKKNNLQVWRPEVMKDF